MRAVLLTAIIATTIVIASSILVDAKAPDGCYCMNGASRASTTYCSCTGCPSPFIGPFCSVKAGTLASIGVTFDNTSETKQFSLDKAQDRLRKALSASSSDLSWMSRSPTYEKAGEVVVLFVIKAELMDKFFADVYSTSQPAYITQQPKILDAWQTGLKTAPASIFSQHIARSAVLGEHELPVSSNIFSSSSSGKNSKLFITGAHMEFFIGALAVLFIAPLLEYLMLRLFKKSDEQLDEEVEKHGGPKQQDELDRRRVMLGRSAPAPTVNPLASRNEDRPIAGAHFVEDQQHISAAPPMGYAHPQPPPATVYPGGSLAAAVLATAAVSAAEQDAARATEQEQRAEEASHQQQQNHYDNNNSNDNHHHHHVEVSAYSEAPAPEQQYSSEEPQNGNGSAEQSTEQA